VTDPPSKNVVTIGRVFFGLPMIAFGAVHLFAGDFVTRFAPGLPAGVPARAVGARGLGALLVAAGLAIVLGKGTRPAALLTGAMIACSLVFLYIPKIAANPGFGGAWTNPAKYLALCGGAFLLAAISPIGAQETERPCALARIFLGVFLTLAGVQHFVYLGFVAKMVPAWIPGSVFWAELAGVALIAAGIGLWIRRTARLAALFSGGMIFVWFLVLHIPRAAASPADMGEWSGVFESLAISGVAFLIAGTVQDARGSATSPGGLKP
jgi:uncharacterized membrane protein YphA (DoxX/SURF4 family)